MSLFCRSGGVAEMQEDLSFPDILGVIGFVWSFISFYIGYLWYRDSGDKDALIAKLTAENELLRREIGAISSPDGGKRRETLHYLRTLDKMGLERANRFYRAAYSFSRSARDSASLYFVIISLLAAAAFIYYTGTIFSLVALVILWPLVGIVMMILFLPLRVYLLKRYSNSRAAKIQRLLEHEGFSFQEVVNLKGWLDQQEWLDRPKKKLGDLLNAHMERLEGAASAPPPQVSPAAAAHSLG
jgi:hypothetical protein